MRYIPSWHARTSFVAASLNWAREPPNPLPDLNSIQAVNATHRGLRTQRTVPREPQSISSRPAGALSTHWSLAAGGARALRVSVAPQQITRAAQEARRTANKHYVPAC